MGHITNAKSYRLGWLHSWSITYYSNRLNYSFYFFFFFRIRVFLLSYFYSKKRDKYGTIYSHLLLLKNIKSYWVKVFFYKTDFEEW